MTTVSTSRAVGLAVITLAAAVTTTSAPAVAAGTSNPGFAGYDVIATKGHQLRSVTQTFVVPRISCRKAATGVGPAIILRSGGSAKSATVAEVGVGAACDGKQPTYRSVVQVDGF